MASRRYRYKNGRQWAQWHIAAAGAFSAEVDGTDRIIKDVFFRLSGTSLDALFTAYERRFGTAAANYARAARERWRRGEVNMSALVSERLYAVMPAFMSADDKRRIVEILWRRYATRSQRYLYVGAGVSINDVMRSVEEHFEALLSYGNLPESLTSRFEWLTDKNAMETRRLIANFVEEQKATAFTAVRVSLIAMSAAMGAGPIQNPDALSHSVAVGDHVLILKADPLRVGFLMSDSATARIKPPSRFDSRGVGTLVALAALICVVVGALSSHPTGSSSGGGYYGNGGSGGGGFGGASGSGGTGASRSGSVGYGNGNSASGRETTSDTTRNGAGGATTVGAQSVPGSSSMAAGGDRLARTGGGPTASSAQSGTGIPAYASSAGAPRSARGNATSTPPLKATAHALKHIAALPSVAHATHAPSAAFAAPVEAPPGCLPRRVARVGVEGSSVDLDDGEHVVVSDAGLMQTQVSAWATGDVASVCTATDRTGTQSVSIEVRKHYAKVQGRLIYVTVRQPVSCSSQNLRLMDNDGEILETADGAIYTVSANGLMRTQASAWSTGDHLSVCTARMHDGDIAAGLENPSHYAIVQASRSGVAARSTVSCKMSRIVAVENDGEIVELAGHKTYQISSAGLMRVQAASWTTGENVQVCSSGVGSGVAASIENPGRYAKVQATRY
jgi:hypothetical protein